jgi:hypothetical protein
MKPVIIISIPPGIDVPLCVKLPRFRNRSPRLKSVKDPGKIVVATPTFKGVTVEIRIPKGLLTACGSMNDTHVQYSTVPEHGTHKLPKTHKVTCSIPTFIHSPFCVSISMLDSYGGVSQGL